MTALNTVAESIPLVFPVHPRTRQMIEKCGITPHQNIQLTKPLSYMDFLNLWKDAVVVMTDSGGLQEETTGLGVPCLTLRENTERPITVEKGSNSLVGTGTNGIIRAAFAVLSGGGKAGGRPNLWDGASSQRIVEHLSRALPMS